jgi:hypothetical protein
MGKILKTTLFTWLGSCLFLSSSCTVFYKTSDIDAKISASIQSANENCNGVVAQITAFQNDYRSLSCEAKSSPFDDALISMGEIDNSKLQMQALQSEIGELFKEEAKSKKELLAVFKDLGYGDMALNQFKDFDYSSSFPALIRFSPTVSKDNQLRSFVKSVNRINILRR